MAGGLRIAGQVEIAGVDAPPDWRRADILLSHVRAMFPDLPKVEPRRWLGHRPSTPDGLPCIGTARDCRQVVHAFGHGHVGLVGSARTARIVAALVGDRAPEVATTAFDPGRFR